MDVFLPRYESLCRRHEESLFAEGKKHCSIVEICKALETNMVEYITHLFVNTASIKDGEV